MAEVPAQVGGLPANQQKDLFEGFSGLNILRQLGLMIGLAASVAIGFAVVLWSQGEDYQLLYADMDRMNPTDVIDILQTNEIAFKIDERSGALLVVSDQIHNARLKLAGEGISPDGSFGFELLDKEQPLGTSQFMENARYRRSLEGELARTISSIRTVRSARVHLAIPKSTTFIRDRRTPTASVFIDLYSGRGLTQDQVLAIANLVSASIPEMKLEDVTVVDERGNLLSNFDADEDMALANKQLDYVQQVEKRLANRIGALLEPLLSADRFRAQVSADVDFTEVEQTDEMFNPDLPAIRSEQTMEESRAGGGVGGVPGALTNQPPASGQAPEQALGGGGAGQQGGSGSSRKTATRNFELDRTISYTRHQVGRIRRLTVAVVVDDVLSIDAESGEKTYISISPAEMSRLTTLVRDAVGYDEARGDSVNVINSRFIPKEIIAEEMVPEVPIWEQPAVQKYIRWGLGFLALVVLMFGVLRPIMKSLTDSARESREMEAQRALGELSGDLGADMLDDTVTLSGGDSMLLPGPDENYEQQVNAIKGLVAEDPGRVAQVVKSWVAASD
jgi:flagellar M-ring protein FliF